MDTIVALLITIIVIQSIAIVVIWRSRQYWFDQEVRVSRMWGNTINERNKWIRKVGPLQIEIESLKQDKKFLAEAYNVACRDRIGLQKMVNATEDEKTERERLRSRGVYSIERIKELNEELFEFNKRDFKDIVLTLNGQTVPISDAAARDWRFIGLSNECFVDMELYTEEGQRALSLGIDL